MRIAGIGFSGRVAPAAIENALASVGPVDGVATAAPKAAALASALPRHAVHGVSVAGIETPTLSARSLAAYGTGSVAEAAALVAAGPGARLVLGRQIIGGVTIAVAEGRNEA